MTQETTQCLILVDGSSYLYRAFHALPPLTTSKGEPTGAVYGVLNMLQRLIDEYQPDYMAVVFDAPGKTFRDDLYVQYKAHRPSMPDELAAQIEPLHTLIGALGIPLIQIPGVEADDVIGTLARQASEAQIHTLISSGDKDLAQLVNERITLINTMTNKVMNPQGVADKFGVPPGRIIDYLTLVGDTSDNIPGVPSVGPKTAVKWLTTYGSLDEIIAHADEIKGKAGENLRTSLARIPLSRDLLTLRCQIEVGQRPTDLHRQAPHKDALREIYRRLEFTSLLTQLGGGGSYASDAESGKASVTAKYTAVLSERDLDAWIQRLQHAPLFAFDTETTDLDYMKADIVGVSFAVNIGEAAYVPMAHDDPETPEQLDRSRVLEKLKPLLEDPGRPKLGQNLKYDMSVLARAGIQLRGVRHDTMLESYVLDSTATRHDMDSLALKYLDYKTIHYEDVAGKGAKQVSFDQVPVSRATPYAAEDADITLCLHQTLWPKIQGHPRLMALYEKIEVPLLSVLSRIERNGVLIDTPMLAQQSKELAKRMVEIEQEAYRVAGKPFNLGSPKQIQTILFDQLKLPVTQTTPKGQPSTAESVLQELALDYPLPRLILDYRSLSKLKSTYTDKLPEQVNPLTGRVHTSYHQAVAATGRLSSSDPNLQNIPVRSEEGRRIRQAFVAPPDYRIVAADYSQIELRIMAHLSGDESLLAAFSQGADIHRSTAAEIFGVAPEAVSDEQRRSAKAINFGLIYGMSAFGLARQLGIPRGAAREYVDRYFARYPGVKAFMDQTRVQAREQGYVETVFGRRLYLADINARNSQRRQYAERTAINAPMQGTAADIIKQAMLRVDDWLAKSGADALMIMQVHDELVFEVAETALEPVIEHIRQGMSEAASLSVPLVVDIGMGDNWEEAH